MINGKMGGIMRSMVLTGDKADKCYQDDDVAFSLALNGIMCLYYLCAYAPGRSASYA